MQRHRKSVEGTERGGPGGTSSGMLDAAVRRLALALGVVGFAAWAAVAAAASPSVASINLCTDQLVLSLADDEQILTLSFLSADPEESLLAAEARRFPLNYGTAEELLRYDPDVVVAGSFTNAYTRALLRSLGYRVVDVAPADSVDDIEANLRAVAAAVGRTERGETLIAALHERRARLRNSRPARRVAAVVVRPGGFTVEKNSLAHELMTLAGLVNVSAEQGLDRWGSLAIETLVRSEPELLIFTGYRSAEASLANTVFDHPALRELAGRVASTTVPATYWACGLPESLDSVAMMQRAAASVPRSVAAARAAWPAAPRAALPPAAPARPAVRPDAFRAALPAALPAPLAAAR